MAWGFLLEDGSGDHIAQEDGGGMLLLETSPEGVPVPIHMYYHLHHLGLIFFFWDTYL